LDASFGGGDGIVTTDIGGSGDYGRAMAIDSQDRIVVAGDSADGAVDLDFAVVRYTSAGVLDASFGGGDGIVTTDIGGSDDYGRAMAIDSQDRIVVAGNASNGSNEDFAVARYTSAGVLDASFGTNGIVTTDIKADTDHARAVAVDSQDRIVAAGDADYYGKNGDVFVVIRYTSAGMLDTSFGGGDGIVTTNFLFKPDDDNARGIVIDSEGRIVVVGEADMDAGIFDDFGVARYLSEDSVPAAPTGVFALSSDGLLAVTWAAPSTCWNCATAVGGASITDYLIEYSSDGGLNWSTFSDGTSATAAVIVTGLSNGVGYVFRVSAVSSAGTGPASVASAAVKPAPVGCTIVGTPGDDVLVGTNGADHICGLGGNDKIYGKAGNDILDGGSGKDKLFGGKGKDRLYGRGGADVLKGGPGNDKLYGGGGKDKLFGQAGKDRLYGQAGKDKLFGGNGKDFLLGGPKKDVLNGGKGKDKAKTPGPDVLVSIETVVP